MLPSGITVREFQPPDCAVCLSIYRAHESVDFPSGFLKFFVDLLDRPDCLKLVLCIGEVPVAVGGIGLTTYISMGDRAWLMFGMVEPAWQRQGLGAALLYARLGALSEPAPSTRIVMTNTGESYRYYSRFGFTSMGSIRSGLPNKRMASSAARLDVADWHRCVENLEALGLDRFKGGVPLINIARPMPV
ncbi:MAG TPA: GNAT family N-acetyltransferase [Steroidobacteraceae bacterium]|nr:GNAT family N-acetyltransferase [Steroidobacteraceae bacterium]